ncbi:molybdopterin converting factor subunit 1 [Polynucleobacter sp. MWH-UH25E]|uniref:molybdopterin converting factor subunit 1 n=1 Tax=Polynucleobacter sp. MWH-UH25E TaxID=1855616 RepID=UPI001BFE559D|nr:molybdopterin converting factor subunit 1 [Polynucleobacter sp. MWH-UH25E]QWD62478.1 molybdopterin converting factor subunit 1 [Polynucleobacter sp. MWH-UH25E]
MKLELRFFASLREVLGTSQETIELPEEVKTVSQLRAHLIARGGVWAEALAEGKSLRCALNQTMVDANATLIDGAEVAFFPPVTGG